MWQKSHINAIEIPSMGQFVADYLACNWYSFWFSLGEQYWLVVFLEAIPLILWKIHGSHVAENSE